MLGLDLDHGAGFKLVEMDDLMPIGEFSERCGLSAKRLRAYAAAGVLVPAAVDSASGYRYYAPGQLRDAQVIDTLRQAGVPLAEIGAILRHPSGHRLDAWARRLQQDAVQRREALDVARRLLAIEGPEAVPRGNQRSGEKPMTKLRTAAHTETGPVRQNNEDAVVASDRLAVVADGMGGHPGGELASAIAAGLVEAAFTGRSLDELEAAVRAANRAIWHRAATDPVLEGMGTTICAAGLIGEGRIAVVNVGDSRAYLLRGGSLTQLTHDHSVTAELVQRGELTEEEAAQHPHRSVLTRALGVGPDVELDGSIYPADLDDRLLLCTDGLFNEVQRDVIAALMRSSGDLDEAARGLVDMAVAGGGRDNVSVVVAQISA